MPRKVIVQVVGLGTLGCAGMVPTPPPTPLPFDEPPPLGRSLKHDQLDRFGERLNPTLEGRGQVYRGGGMCWVHGEFDEPPGSWQPAPRDYVECPDELRHDNWEACPGGTVRAAENRERCVCLMDGNPPPPPRIMVCPEEA